MKLKLSMILLFLLKISLSFPQGFTIEKVNDIYKADDYRKIIKHDNFLLASGERALHLLSNDENGFLIEFDELPLWGELGVWQQSESILLSVCGDYIFILGSTYGANPTKRLYKILLNNHSLTLIDSLTFSDNNLIDHVIIANNHIFVLPHYYDINSLQIYDIDNLEIVAEYDYPSFFSDNDIYKLNDNILYTWDSNNSSLMHLFDINDVTNIQEITEIDFNASFPEIDLGVTKIINDTVICMCNPAQYSFFDISDIADWQFLGSLEFPYENALFNLAILSDTRIIIPLTSGSVSLYDITNFENIIQVSNYNYDSIYNLDGCICSDNYFYRVDTRLGIHQFKIHNDQFEYLETFPEFQGKRGVYMNDDLLAIRTQYWGGMHFYDKTDINNIHYVCTHFDNHFQYACDFEDDLLVVPLVSYPQYEERIDVYNVSDIENPVLVDRIENVFAEYTYLQYPYLYSREKIITSNEYHFVKYDISEPFNAQVVYDFDLSPNMYGYFKSGDYVYYRGGEETINVLGNLDGDYPEIVATLYIDNLSGFWPINNNSFITRNESNIIELYSLENPIEPELLFDYPYTSNNWSCGIYDDLFFIGDYTINIFNVENGYNIYDPLYELEMPFSTSIRYFIEEDNNNYLLLTSSTGVSLYRYEYDNTIVFEDELPTPEFTLTNYPNPFNPSTTISFNLPEDSGIQLEIFNIKGQKIISLLSDQITAGEHSIIWNGVDIYGKKVGSGVYLYKLEVNGKIEAVKKCLLMK